MAFLFFLAVVVLIAFRITTAEDRKRLLQKAVVILRELVAVASEEHAKLDPFRAALRARTAWAILAPALVALNVVVFIMMLFGPGALSDPATLIKWGASYGPRTSNGEWLRLLTSMFVHGGILRTAIEAAALAQVGILLERLVGRPTLATVFCSAGALAGIVNLAIYPMGTASGTSGAIFGLYGLLLASVVRSLRARAAMSAQRESYEEPPDLLHEGIHEETGAETGAESEQPAMLVVPLPALLWLAPVAALFILSAWSNDGFAFKADAAGLGVGIVAGLVLTGDIARHAPQPRAVLVTSIVLLVALAACAVPLRGIADVRPEIARIVALEDRTAGVYQTALERVNKGAMSAEALARLIDRTIVPELEAADAHLMSIRGVPREHRQLVADAHEYLGLRSASWRLYAESWRSRVRAPRREADGTLVSDATWRQVKAQFRADAATRGKAEGTERASLEALQRIRGDIK